MHDLRKIEIVWAPTVADRPRGETFSFVVPCSSARRSLAAVPGDRTCPSLQYPWPYNMHRYYSRRPAISLVLVVFCLLQLGGKLALTHPTLGAPSKLEDVRLSFVLLADALFAQARRILIALELDLRSR